jgi:cytochrome c553
MKLIAPLILAAAGAFALPAMATDAAHGAAPAKAPKADLAKGEATFAAVCAGCHGADGNSPAPTYPKLAQQHPEYLVKQLQEFKSGKRANPIMSGFATALSDDDMKNVAYFITTKKSAAGASTDKTLVSLGERIYRGGIADRQIPACAGCHSPNGSGIPAQYPRLAGQWGDYVAAQLVAFRDGVRGNSLQMTQVAAKMNDKEIKAVADYIAGLR